MTKAADLETEKIKQNKEKPEAKRKHKFKAAKWTLPNGHPRCIICGDEERIGGICDPMEKSEVVLQRRNPFNKSEQDIQKMKNKIDKIFKEVVEENHLDYLLKKPEDDLQKSDNFVRRGILLAALAGTAQHVHNELKGQKEEASRPYASQKEQPQVEIPKTEPEKAYNQAEKDAFGIAAKHMNLSRNLARATIKANPELHRDHGYLLHLSPNAFSEVIDNNPEIKRDIALKHYDSLYDLHQGDRDKIFDSYKKKAMGLSKKD